MDANQREFRNPFGMDTDCRNCEALCETRTQVVHGYGDVAAEFLVVGESPDDREDETGIPLLTHDRIRGIFAELGFVRPDTGGGEEADAPDVQNVFFTSLTRCRHPDRGPTSEEIDTCEPFLNAEIRMINPQILVPVGQRTLEALALDYTTRRPESFDVADEHATTVRGRGFELVPMLEPEAMTDADADAFRDHLQQNVLSRDYRQTKGRRQR